MSQFKDPTQWDCPQNHVGVSKGKPLKTVLMLGSLSGDLDFESTLPVDTVWTSHGPFFCLNIIELYPTQWDRPQNYVGHQYENSVEWFSFWKPLHTFGDGPIGVRHREIVTFERFGCAFWSELLKCYNLTTPHNETAPKIMWGFSKGNPLKTVLILRLTHHMSCLMSCLRTH